MGKGNTFHGNGRFGTYFNDGNWPKHIDQSLAYDGLVGDMSTCTGFYANGSERGLGVVVQNNVDYGNAFVGSYDSGDIQWKGHVGVQNLNNIYWKTTKNFADGCAAHFDGSHYEDGNMVRTYVRRSVGR